MRNPIRRLAIASLLVGAAFLGAAPAISAEHCNPDDPRCQHQQWQKKDHCYFTRTGAPATGATFGATPALQLLTLSCPNHILLDVEYGYKDCRFPVGSPECDPTLANPIVTDLGASSDPADPCAWKRSWTVYAPNVNVFTFWFKAYTYKDENCDGKADDWNAEAVGPTGETTCYWVNYFGPKPWDNPPGMNWPYYAPPYGPTPDGQISYCDLQVYETQWRQFN